MNVQFYHEQEVVKIILLFCSVRPSQKASAIHLYKVFGINLFYLPLHGGDGFLTSRIEC